MKKLILPTGLVLVAFYIVLLILILNPKVSQDYHDYYISQTSNISLHERAQLQPIAPGQSYSHKSDTHFGFDGWSGAEENHRWSDGYKTNIIFRTNAHYPIQTLTFKLFPLKHQRLTIQLNGEIVFNENVLTANEITIPISEASSGGLNYLQFLLPDAHQPSSSDHRLLGIALQAIRAE